MGRSQVSTGRMLVALAATADGQPVLFSRQGVVAPADAKK